MRKSVETGAGTGGIGGEGLGVVDVVVEGEHIQTGQLISVWMM
jgi:hypothetical protein